MTSTHTTAELCAACELRPNGHGHFALYCAPCAELPYGVSAPVQVGHAEGQHTAANGDAASCAWCA